MAAKKPTATTKTAPAKKAPVPKATAPAKPKASKPRTGGISSGASFTLTFNKVAETVVDAPVPATIEPAVKVITEPVEVIVEPQPQPQPQPRQHALDVAVEAMVKSDRQIYDELTAKIGRGLSGFIEAGRAMKQLRDGKYFRSGGFDTFEQCVKQLFGLERSHAYQTIRAADCAAELAGCVEVPNVATARVLLTVDDPDQRRAVAQRALTLATAEAGREALIMGRHVETAKVDVLGAKPKAEPNVDDVPIRTMKAVLGDMPEIKSAAARLGVPIGGCSEKMFSQLMFTVLADIWATRRRVI